MKTGFLANLIGGKGADIITSVGEVADKFITTGEERAQFDQAITAEVNRHVEAMQSEATKELEVYTKDIMDARKMNSTIQESDKASWMSKNIAYILDLVFVVAFLIMLVMVFFRVVPESNKEIFYTGFGLLGGYVGSVINFHRGTSIGSKENGAALRKMVNHKSGTVIVGDPK